MAIFLAAWFQQADIATTQHWILILTGILTIAFLGLAIVGSIVLVNVLKSIKTFTGIASDFQEKAAPVIQELTVISRHTRELLDDAKPKIKTITDHMAAASVTLSETATIAKSTVQKVDATVTDANARTQRQVARVDSMVSAALNTTAEVVEAVNHGIRVPAQKIAQAAGQARVVAEGLLDRIKGMTGSMPFVGHKPASRPASSSRPAGYRSSGAGTGSSASTSSAAGTASSEPAGRTYAAAPNES